MHITPTDLLEPADPLTPEQALAERERLRDDLARLKAVADEAAARDREIKAEVKTIKAEQSQARMDAVSKGGKAPRRRDELDQLELETEEVAETLEAAKVMRRKVETDLHYLLVRQFEAFAEHAESLGAKAAKALEDLRPAYEEVVRLWGDSRTEWDVLTRAHNEGRGGPGPTVRADGSVRTREDAPPPLSKAPACPLPPVAEVFDGGPPRPPELQVTRTERCPVCGASLVGRRADAVTCGASCRRELSRLRAILRGSNAEPYESLSHYLNRPRRRAHLAGEAGSG